MGHRTYLALGARCGFEANNCLPATWLALFDVREFALETRRFEYEKPKQQQATAPNTGLFASLSSLLNWMGRRVSPESSPPQSVVEIGWEECEVMVFKMQLVKKRRAKK